MVRQFLTRFMMGRYGMDQLNLFLVVAYLVLYLFYAITGWLVLYWMIPVPLLVSLFRILSRNIPRRQAENSSFLAVTRPIKRRFHTFRVRMGDREHRYFKCPNCSQEMRVPRGKGRITVHCRTCGTTFEEKS